MMKKLISVLAIAVASVTLSVPAAQANTPGCVSKAEYARVHKGLSVTQVSNLFHTSGRVTRHPGPARVIRRYDPCPRHSIVRVTFRRGNVSGKAALWNIP